MTGSRHDIVGEALRRSPEFPGKGRLRSSWRDHRVSGDVRRCSLPGGATISAEVWRPYEANVWLGTEARSALVGLSEMLRPGDLFVDCGANIGMWTFVAGACTRPGRVVAIEPNPTVFARLEENAARNADLAVDTYRLAVGAQVGTVDFLPEDDHNLSHIVSSDTTDAVRVDVVPLDDLMRAQHPAGIKIDAQGTEADVLRGAEHTVHGPGLPWVVIEFGTRFTPAELPDWDSHRLLTGWGLEPWVLTDLHAGPLRSKPPAKAHLCYRWPC